MSKLKKTPLTKFIEVIEENREHFEDKGFLHFLLDAGSSFLEKEKKAISKAYNSGVSDCIQNTKNDTKCLDGYDAFGLVYSDRTKTSNRKDEINNSIKSLLETLGKIRELEKDLSNDVEETISEKVTEKEQSNDAKIEEFCKTLSETPININKDSDVSTEKQVEELLMKRLQEVGIEPKSVQIIKL